MLVFILSINFVDIYINRTQKRTWICYSFLQQFLVIPSPWNNDPLKQSTCKGTKRPRHAHLINLNYYMPSICLYMQLYAFPHRQEWSHTTATSLWWLNPIMALIPQREKPQVSSPSQTHHKLVSLMDQNWRSHKLASTKLILMTESNMFVVWKNWSSDMSS